MSPSIQLDDCSCAQHGDFCNEHPRCACGCPRHAHRGNGPCIAGSMNCHGCDAYRPATLKRFRELYDHDLEDITLDALKLAYRDLRAHHIEETTAILEGERLLRWERRRTDPK